MIVVVGLVCFWYLACVVFVLMEIRDVLLIVLGILLSSFVLLFVSLIAYLVSTFWRLFALFVVC